MASVRKEFTIEAPAERVWAALADFQAVHKRVAPGFVTDSKPDGDDARIVTFANGTSARETLVDSDAKQKRLVYAIAGSERLTHHNASAQVIADGANKCRFIWITDLLPNAVAPYVDAQMQQGAEVMKRALEGK
ncbi:MAG: SRPBCC family protein [Alphaproteobacteria bacterium]|nr:SRPBCC family protein [Alphaproteobacteria bacterium]